MPKIVEETFLNRVIHIILFEFISDNQFNPQILALKLNMSRSCLYRKIKSATNLSPCSYIRDIRLQHACVLLKETNMSIKEITFAVGFSNQHYFCSCFKNKFQATPSQFHKQSIN